MTKFFGQFEFSRAFLQPFFSTEKNARKIQIALKSAVIQVNIELQKKGLESNSN